VQQSDQLPVTALLRLCWREIWFWLRAVLILSVVFVWASLTLVLLSPFILAGLLMAIADRMERFRLFRR
jgi:hypothetical protein